MFGELLSLIPLHIFFKSLEKELKASIKFVGLEKIRSDRTLTKFEIQLNHQIKNKQSNQTWNFFKLCNSFIWISLSYALGCISTNGKI